jgi:hypothetical protein
MLDQCGGDTSMIWSMAYVPLAVRRAVPVTRQGPPISHVLYGPLVVALCGYVLLKAVVRGVSLAERQLT